MGDETPYFDVLASLGYVRPAWQKDALCKEHPEVEWHPGRGQSAAPAIAVCRQCLVVEPCLAWAMTDPQLFGVLGATSYKARRPRRATNMQTNNGCEADTAEATDDDHAE